MVGVMAGKDEKRKTAQTMVKPVDFIAELEHDTRRADATVLLEMLGRISEYRPKMWGPSIIGFGRYHYVYASGTEGDSMVVGFSPRKANQVIYLMPGYEDLTEMLGRLGKHKIGKSCLYINKLADVDLTVLEEIVVHSVNVMESTYETFAE